MNVFLRLAPVFLCLALLTLNVGSMRHLSVTYDEPRHFQYGQNILNLDPTRFDDSKMPFSALNALTWKVSTYMEPGPLARTLAQLETGRYATVLFSMLVAVCVFSWGRQLYGLPAGVLAMTLYTLDPNLLAHAQLVTTDVYAAGMITIALYVFWIFLRRGGLGWALACGVALGLTQLAKYTGVVLLPLFALIAAGYHYRDLRAAVREHRLTDLRGLLVRFCGWAVLLAALSVIVINAGFLFNGTFTPLRDYTFRSDTFRQIQDAVGPLASIPIPLPYPYVEGLDWITQRERTGDGYGYLYLLGEVRRGEGFNGYYFYAALYKTPIATLLVLLAAIATYIARRRRFDFFRNEWVLVCPVLFFTVYFNFFYRAQIGIRHFLVVYPLLYVFTGSLLKPDGIITRRATAAVSLAVVLLLASVLSFFPHYIPYFNELVGDRKLAYRILADSNLDWRQHAWYFRRYLDEHPDAIVEPQCPTAGSVVVGVNMLTGVAGEPDRYRWLREHFTPVDHVAYAILVYDIRESELERIAPSHVPLACRASSSG